MKIFDYIIWYLFLTSTPIMRTLMFAQAEYTDNKLNFTTNHTCLANYRNQIYRTVEVQSYPIFKQYTSSEISPRFTTSEVRSRLISVTGGTTLYCEKSIQLFMELYNSDDDLLQGIYAHAISARRFKIDIANKARLDHVNRAFSQEDRDKFEYVYSTTSGSMIINELVFQNNHNNVMISLRHEFIHAFFDSFRDHIGSERFSFLTERKYLAVKSEIEKFGKELPKLLGNVVYGRPIENKYKKAFLGLEQKKYLSPEGVYYEPHNWIISKSDFQENKFYITIGQKKIPISASFHSPVIFNDNVNVDVVYNNIEIHLLFTLYRQFMVYDNMMKNNNGITSEFVIEEKIACLFQLLEPSIINQLCPKTFSMMKKLINRPLRESNFHEVEDYMFTERYHDRAGWLMHFMKTDNYDIVKRNLISELILIRENKYFDLYPSVPYVIDRVLSIEDKHIDEAFKVHLKHIKAEFENQLNNNQQFSMKFT